VRVVPWGTPPGGQSSRFSGIDAGGDVAVGKQQAERSLRGKADVGVDEEEMGELRIGQEVRDAVVTGAGDEAVAAPEVKIEFHPGVHRGALKLEQAKSVVEAEHAAIAGRGDQRLEAFQGGWVKQRLCSGSLWATTLPLHDCRAPVKRRA